MKKLLFLLILIGGAAKAQPVLSITGWTSYSQTSFSTYAYITYYNVSVKNEDSTTALNDTLYIGLGIEDPPGTVTPITYWQSPNPLSIGTLATTVIDSAYFWVDTAYLKDGNNTVVIWPYTIWTSSETKDSLVSDTWIEIGGETATTIAPNEEPLTVIIGPNPTRSTVTIVDPENIFNGVIVETLDGKRIPLPSSGKIIDVSHLPQGMYLFRIQTSKGIVSRKIIVER